MTTTAAQFANWQPHSDCLTISTIDMHTGGEPLRVITAGFPALDATSILAKRQQCLSQYDHLRKALMFEPRGHADMYGALVVEPERSDSQFGVLFLHNEGYSTMCGHAIVALAKLAFESGAVASKDGENCLNIDAPAGQIKAKVLMENNRASHISFDNVSSFLAFSAEVSLAGIGKVAFDLAYGGAFYAFVDADSIDLSLSANNSEQIILWGKRIKQAVIEHFAIEHPFEADLSFLYGVIFTSNTQTEKADSFSRHVCIFAEGELDRSPTGTGVSARVAIEVAKGNLQLHENVKIESILGSQFDVFAHTPHQYGEHHALIPNVAGTAHVTGKHNFILDPDDPLVNGFIFR